MAATDTARITKPSPIVETDQGELVARRGVSLEVIRELSRIKDEPRWMAEKRERSFEIFQRKPIPTWGPDLSGLNFDELVLYSPPTTGRRRTRISASRRPSASTSPALSAYGARSRSTKASKRSTPSRASSSARWTPRCASTPTSSRSTS
jgi:hypothetical protein